LLVVGVVVALAAWGLHTGLETLRAALLVQGRGVLGRPWTVGRIAPSLWPFGVRLSGLTIAEDARQGPDALVTVKTALVGLRPWSLLGGRLDVDLLTVHGGTVVIRRWARDRPLIVGDVRLRATRTGTVVRVDEIGGSLDGHPWSGAGAVDTGARRARLALRQDAGTRDRSVPVPWLPTEARLALALEDDGACRVAGRAILADVPVVLAGRVLDLDPLALDLRLGGRPFDGAVKGRIVPGATAGALRVRAVLRAIDVAAVGAHFGTGERLEGRAAGTVALAVEPGTVAGRGVLRLEAGRVRGVNLVRDVFAALERTPLLRAVVGGETRRRHPALFAADETILTAATVPFTIDDGRLVSDAVHVVGDPYEVVGRGAIDAHGRLRFQGDLVIAAGLTEALVRDLRVLAALRRDDGRLVVPFQLRGPLDHPRVEPDIERLGTRGLAALVEGLRGAGKQGAGGLADLLRNQLERWGRP
jgi:hypothetical protein